MTLLLLKCVALTVTIERHALPCQVDRLDCYIDQGSQLKSSGRNHEWMGIVRVLERNQNVFHSVQIIVANPDLTDIVRLTLKMAIFSESINVPFLSSFATETDDLNVKKKKRNVIENANTHYVNNIYRWLARCNFS